VIVAGTILLSAGGMRLGFRPGQLVLPLLSAVCFGVVAVLRKLGLSDTGPIVGSAINVTTALIAFTTFLLASGARRSWCVRGRSLAHFVAAGLTENAGVFMNVLALGLGTVSVVTPLYGTAPIFRPVPGAVLPARCRDVQRSRGGGNRPHRARRLPDHRAGGTLTMPVLAAVILIILVATTARAQETRMVPVTVDGERVRLQMRVYPPTTDTPAPTLVFNHGSTGTGTNPEAFARPLDFPEVARFFVARGWAVVIPARVAAEAPRGTYDEGFCRIARGATRAIRRCRSPGRIAPCATSRPPCTRSSSLPFVDRTRVVIGGQSRGGRPERGVRGQHPERVKGVINFVGGWNGTRCQHAATINQSLFVRGARYPDDTMWIYGDGDLFYSLAHSRANFAAFQSAGGQGAFHELPTEAGGHLPLAAAGSVGAARRELPEASRPASETP